MKKECSNAETNIFFRHVQPCFDVLKIKIEKRAKKNKIPFNEDVFMDTLIKCSTTFSKENVTNIEIENYLWRAFKQNSFSYFSRNKFRDTINLDEFGDDIIDEEYNPDIDEIVDLIKEEVKSEFGPQIYDAWLLHVCNNYTYEELEKYGYKGLNLHNEFRQIKRHICSKFIKTNTKLKTLLIENNFL